MDNEKFIEEIKKKIKELREASKADTLSMKRNGYNTDIYSHRSALLRADSALNVAIRELKAINEL